MTSLTPAHRSDEAVAEAAWEGGMNGLCTLLPSIGLVALAYYRHPTFALRTTAASRTALAIMPATFVAGLSSELRMVEKMREMAHENQHNRETVAWAEEQWQQQSQQQHNQPSSTLLSALYEESVTQRGTVQIVPSLLWYHHAANFTSANPLKVLTAIAVPAVGYIYYGRTGQNHLQRSSMIMHTRVFGQGVTLASLLLIMGFKSYMDTNIGRYMSQDQADVRVQQMQHLRNSMQAQLDAQQQHRDDLRREIDVLSSSAKSTTLLSSSSTTAVSVSSSAAADDDEDEHEVAATASTATSTEQQQQQQLA
jgi:hypothetical protein